MSLIKKVLKQASEFASSLEEDISFAELAGAYINAGAVIACRKLGPEKAAIELTNALVLATKNNEELIQKSIQASIKAYIIQQQGAEAILAHGIIHKHKEIN